ncbi:MAG: transglycosylase SLT domain-containing protein [Rhodospirillales bacterium]|nr:transglycosylase SLT domain-containing protein [Rhodospirillales bacterium]
MAAASVQAAPAPADPWRVCRQAISAAEQAERLPRHLLAAIALVESGRPSEASGTVPWPWTITAEGRGRFLASKADAVSAVQELRERDVRNIDVGCMQVNMHYHPRAFADLDAAFDPAANAGYAARHLRALFRQAGSWPSAVSLYHNGKFHMNRQYRIRVMKVWSQLRGRPSPASSG